MRIRPGNRIFLLFLVMILAGFDPHLSSFFSDEVKALTITHAGHTPNNLPVSCSNSLEEGAIKSMFCSVPAPSENPFRYGTFIPLGNPESPPLNVWQPPEDKS